MINDNKKSFRFSYQKPEANLIILSAESFMMQSYGSLNEPGSTLPEDDVFIL